MDCKAVYKCLHFDPKMIVQAIILIGTFLLMALWMTFGSAPTQVNGAMWASLPPIWQNLFLGWLCEALYAAKHKCHIKWTPLLLEDFELWKGFLDSLNRLTFHPPSWIERSDACEHGIGGFSAITGIAWRWKIPLDLQNWGTLNVLEYLVRYLSIWMDIDVAKKCCHRIVLLHYAQRQKKKRKGLMCWRNYD
jgi:hypothetical protein